jgi:hypothetical protein
MPRQNQSASFPNGIRASDLTARFWGTTRSPANNRVPRSAIDVYSALACEDAVFLLSVANSLASNFSADTPISSILPQPFYENGNPADVSADTPIKYHFVPAGSFTINFASTGADAEIYDGMSRAGIHALRTAITMMLNHFNNIVQVAVDGGASVSNPALETANARLVETSQRIRDLEGQLAVSKRNADILKDEVKLLDGLLKDNDIARPTECLNCGKYKTTEEDFGVKVIQPRMGTRGKSLYGANEFYYSYKEGGFVKCENPETGEGSYKETLGAHILFFGNTWNSCSKQEGDEGLCRECSFATLGMLTPKNTNTKKVGGFEYSTPICCFHQGCASECGIVWKKAPQLLCAQIVNTPILNTLPIHIARGIVPKITPSMVVSTGQMVSHGVVIEGRSIDGGGNSNRATIGRFLGEEEDTTMKDYIASHIARGRTHQEQVQNRELATELEEDLTEEELGQEVRPADEIVFDTLISD